MGKGDPDVESELGDYQSGPIPKTMRETQPEADSSCWRYEKNTAFRMIS